MANAGVCWDDLGRCTSSQLFFPPLQLSRDAGERVTAIRVTITCGYVTGVSRIPGDWWIEIRGTISAETTLSASAGHGASYLWRLETWNGSISITPYDMSCFDASAVVISERGDSDESKQHVYSRKQLKLKQ